MTVQTAGFTTTPVIDQIEALVANVPGWTPIDQLYALFQLAHTTAELPGDIVEIGSWCGRSALVLGLAASLAGRSKVFCVDLFPERDDWTQNSDGSYSCRVTIDGHIYGGHQDQTVWQEPFERDIVPVYAQNPSLQDHFRENVSRHPFQNVITSFRGNSEMFAGSVAEDFRCRLAFLDGGHSYESVCQDIENLETFLVPGAWICFDDAFSSYDGVNRAIEDRIIKNPRFDREQQMTRKFFIARKRS